MAKMTETVHVKIDRKPRDVHEAEIDIFNTALDYMSYDEWVALCRKITEAYEAKAKRYED